MENRTDLMRLIFDLDTELSSAQAPISPDQKRDVLAKCADILDRAGDGEEFVVCQAIHLLVRKHDLEPEYHWPDRHGTAPPQPSASTGWNLGAGALDPS